MIERGLDFTPAESGGRADNNQRNALEGFAISNVADNALFQSIKATGASTDVRLACNDTAGEACPPVQLSYDVPLPVVAPGLSPNAPDVQNREIISQETRTNWRSPGTTFGIVLLKGELNDGIVPPIGGNTEYRAWKIFKDGEFGKGVIQYLQPKEINFTDETGQDIKLSVDEVDFKRQPNGTYLARYWRSQYPDGQDADYFVVFGSDGKVIQSHRAERWKGDRLEADLPKWSDAFDHLRD